MKKLIKYIFLSQIIISDITAMEERALTAHETTIKNLVPELKSRIMLFIAGDAIKKTNNIQEAIQKIKDTIKNDPDMLTIFEGDKELSPLFTQNLINVFKNKFIKSWWHWSPEICTLCIAAEINTKAAVKLLKDKYEKNPSRLYLVIIQKLRDLADTKYLAPILKISEKVLPLQIIRKLFTYRTPNSNETILQTLLFGLFDIYNQRISDRPRYVDEYEIELITLILEKADKYLSAEEKDKFINNDLVGDNDKNPKSDHDHIYMGKNARIFIINQLAKKPLGEPKKASERRIKIAEQISKLLFKHGAK